MCVFISNKHAYTQVIDDSKGTTLCSVSTLSKDIRDQIKDKNMTQTLEIIGAAISEKAKAAGVEKVVFDRSGYKYGKRLGALCEAARKGGLSF